MTDRNDNAEAAATETAAWESLRAVIEDMSGELLLRPLLTRIIRHACDLIGADNGAIGLYDPEKDVIRTEATYRMPPNELGSEMQRGVGLAGKVLATGEPVDRAVNEARLVLATETSEWATPVLFMPSKDGRLFSLGKPKGSRATSGGTRIGASVTAKAGSRSRAIGFGAGSDSEATASPSRRHTLAIHSMTVPGEIRWGDEMRKNADDYLELDEYFDGRPIRDPSLWNTAVFPRLERFLHKWARTGEPLLLDFAAHASIAFAAGWVLEIKSGLDIEIRQRGRSKKSLEWEPDDGTGRPEPRSMFDGYSVGTALRLLRRVILLARLLNEPEHDAGFARGVALGARFRAMLPYEAQTAFRIAS